jgi:hypothetical protein
MKIEIKPSGKLAEVSWVNKEAERHLSNASTLIQVLMNELSSNKVPLDLDELWEMAYRLEFALREYRPKSDALASKIRSALYDKEEPA